MRHRGQRIAPDGVLVHSSLPTRSRKRSFVRRTRSRSALGIMSTVVSVCLVRAVDERCSGVLAKQLVHHRWRAGSTDMSAADAWRRNA